MEKRIGIIAMIVAVCISVSAYAGIGLAIINGF